MQFRAMASWHGAAQCCSWGRSWAVLLSCLGCVKSVMVHREIHIELYFCFFFVGVGMHKWPKCWSFSIRLSNEYSGLFSFRINWFDLLAFQGTFKSLLQHNSKAFILWCSGFTWWLRRWRIRLQCKRLSLNPWVGKISLRREWLPNPYSCLENSIDRGA